MKIQSLAIMFIILILPISLVLSSYTQNRVETLSLQARYDSRLNSATYDALKAYQLNSFNSDSGSLVNSKIRDIKASSNAFFTALASNFSTVGYTKETLQNYVPALVYTMYDGYYMYSPYTNTLDEETRTRYHINGGNSLYGLKPYVYYSCRYVGFSSKGNYDVVITYSLDNYINIQGVVNNKVISKYGYLLSDVQKISDEKALYKNIQIEPENFLTEYVSFDGNVKECSYIKINGTKYYLDSSNIFSVNNGKSNIKYDLEFPDKDSNAVNYYIDSINMRDFIQDSGLDEITVDQAVDSQGKPFNDSNSPFTKIDKIFDFDHNNGIEAKDSNFNVHRQDVIKYAITKNLSVAISNYNNYSGVSGVDFQMPMLKDTDWDKIMDNISIISFLQGMNIGGKIYNGYSIITNTKNEDVVTEDSIYIRTGTSEGNFQFHRVNEENLEKENNLINPIGIFNVDTERRTTENSQGLSIYYYPKYGIFSYDSVVTQNKVKDKSLISKEVLKVYYTALGRERHSMYREKLKSDLSQLKGDINYDGVVDELDIGLLKSYIAGRNNLNSEQIKRADINEDGYIRSDDAMLLEKMI